jgi:hypothetical protein
LLNQFLTKRQLPPLACNLMHNSVAPSRVPFRYADAEPISGSFSADLGFQNNRRPVRRSVARNAVFFGCICLIDDAGSKPLMCGSPGYFRDISFRLVWQLRVTLYPILYSPWTGIVGSRGQS